MEKGSLVMLAEELSEAKVEWLKKHNVPVPIFGQTVCELSEDPKELPKRESLFPIGIKLIEYLRWNFYWNIRDWIEVQGPTTIDIQPYMEAKQLPVETQELVTSY